MELPDFDTIFQAYQKEIVSDIQMDELTIKEKSMLVPIVKHKWVTRMMVHKVQLQKLENNKKQLIAKYASANPISLSKSTLDRIAKENPDVQKIQELIDNVSLLIEYLEKVEKLTSSLTFDCKNVIDIQKLETT
jgi:hypothetical protein